MENIMNFEILLNINILSILAGIMIMASIYLLGNYIERVRLKGKDPKNLSEIFIFSLFIIGIVLFFVSILN